MLRVTFAGRNALSADDIGMDRHGVAVSSDESPLHCISDCWPCAMRQNQWWFADRWRDRGRESIGLPGPFR